MVLKMKAVEATGLSDELRKMKKGSDRGNTCPIKYDPGALVRKMMMQAKKKRVHKNTPVHKL